MTPLFAEIEMGSVIVAVSLIVLVAIIMVAAILKYTADGVLKLWGGLGTLVGLITGTMGGYFFTREVQEQQVARLESEKATVIAQKDAVMAQVRNGEEALKTAQVTQERLQEQLLALSTGKPTILFGRGVIPTLIGPEDTDPVITKRWNELLEELQAHEPNLSPEGGPGASSPPE